MDKKDTKWLYVRTVHSASSSGKKAPDKSKVFTKASARGGQRVPGIILKRKKKENGRETTIETSIKH